MAPMPIEASVMPTWIVETYSLISSICPTAWRAPFLPSSASASSRVRRLRTSAYSAITKKPLSATSSAVRKIRSAVTARCYFGRGRRSSATTSLYPGQRLSICSASARSLSVRPPSLCVDSVRRTLFHPCTRRSGGGLRCSAISATWLTKRIASAKSLNLKSRTRASSSCRQSLPCSLMRIVSLVPHATELLFALGLGDFVVGVTHECDHPREAQLRTRVTRDVLPGGLSPGEIEAAGRERTERGESIYALDDEVLRRLEPDLIVTQALCPVCAVSYDEVVARAEKIESCPKVIALDPKTFGETMGDVRTVAQATGAKEAALMLIASASRRIDNVKVAVKGVDRPRVACLEWLDPVFVAGHWTPQLVELAGGEDVLGFAGEPSERSTWEAVAAARPEVVVVMPCGYDAGQSLAQARAFAPQLASLGARRIVAVDAAADFSAPGPRLVDGVELLAHVLHPDRVPDPPEGAVALEVDLATV